MVICFDETGVSPLPPGILVTISSVTPAAPSIKLLTESGNILTTESGIELSVAPATPQTQTIAYSGYTQLGGMSRCVQRGEGSPCDGKCFSVAQRGEGKMRAVLGW